MINRQRVLTDFLELVQMECSTRKERTIADLLTRRLTGLGLTVSEDEAGRKIGGNCGNLIANLKGTVTGIPVLMFAAHMDCVEPCAQIKPRIDNGIITSSGDTILGSDDKAGVAAIMEALTVIKENGIPHGDIQIVFTVAEEGGLNGSKNIDRTLLKADLGFEMDSSGDSGSVIIAAPGQNSLTVTVRGKKAHAGLAPEEGINAIVVAGKALAQMKLGRIDAETTANVGIIRGGTATNIVPDEVTVLGEARSRDLQKLRQQTVHMKETFEQVAAAHGARAEVLVKEMYRPYALDEDTPVIQLAKRAIAGIGLEPKLEPTGGGSDANFYNSYGIPCANLSVGMQKAHTTEEYIREEDLYRSAQIVVAIIQEAVRAGK